MSRQTQSRGADRYTVFSAAMSVMLTLPLAPMLVEVTSGFTYRALIGTYGPDLTELAMLVHLGACFVVTFFGLLIAIDSALRLFVQKTSRGAQRSRNTYWH